MKSVDYVFIGILLLYFVSVLSVVILLTKESRNSYVEMNFRDNIVRNIDIEIHDADFVINIPEGGLSFDNCTFLVEGGNYQITTASWRAKQIKIEGEK